MGYGKQTNPKNQFVTTSNLYVVGRVLNDNEETQNTFSGQYAAVAGALLYAGTPLTVKTEKGITNNFLNKEPFYKVTAAVGVANTSGSLSINAFAIATGYMTADTNTGAQVGAYVDGSECAFQLLGAHTELVVPCTNALISAYDTDVNTVLNKKVVWNFTTSNTAPFGALDLPGAGVTTDLLPVTTMRLAMGYIPTIVAGVSTYVQGRVAIIKLLMPSANV